MPLEQREEQKCAMCRNHGDIVAIKGHRKCPRVLPEHMKECAKCFISQQRRLAGASEIRRNRKATKNQSAVHSGSETDESQYICRFSKRKPQECRKCRNHGIINRIVGGHRNKCSFSSCQCFKCQETNFLRESMKIENQFKRSNQSSQAEDSSSQDSSESSMDSSTDFTEDPKLDELPINVNNFHSFESAQNNYFRNLTTQSDYANDEFQNPSIRFLLRTESFDSVKKEEFDKYLKPSNINFRIK